tara:strand:- start:1417 stop:2658 length:1242 start_codon:yes stop_codon:yes gene_type:complete
MKRKLLIVAAILTGGITLAQTTETISIGAGYVNENYYKLSDGSENSVVRADWDLAFAANGLGFASSTIRINGGSGAVLYKYSNTISDWSTVDTTSFDWSTNKLRNSDEDWTTGAFNSLIPTSAFDLGWGTYSTATHVVSGDRIFILKLVDGSFRKLIVENLQGGVYTVKYADINGANETTKTVTKSTYSGKKFGYLSVQNGTVLDREPIAASWDLLFTGYQRGLDGYGVKGVLANSDVKVARAHPVNDPTTEGFAGKNFTSDIGTIGYDWKTINFSTFQWDITDSLVYFVEVPNKDVYRIIFTAFGGSSNGNFVFTKEKIGTTVGIEDGKVSEEILNVYPNPATSEINLTFIGGAEQTLLSIYDVSGKEVFQKQINNIGLNQENIDVSNLDRGIYILMLTTENSHSSQKIIIQ